nr:glycosyltransferase [Paenibacillus yonginensis]
MIQISLCMIVRNEEDTIGRCLSSVYDLVEEINIVDTGSTDRTKEIVSRYTDRIYDFVWIQDFAAARNYAFSQATKPYILWLDADDVLQEADRKKFAELKQTLDPSIDSVTMKYDLAFDEYGNVISSLRRNRLVKRANGFKWIGPVHEYLEVGGHIYDSDISVTHSSLHHDSDRNLNIYEAREQAGEDFSPRDLYYFANELLDHKKYEKAIAYYHRFLATGLGWVEDNIAACGKLADAYTHLGHKDKALESTLRTLQYGSPRPEACCRLGYYFLNEQDYRSAVFWYELATQIRLPAGHLGLAHAACSTWLPHLQLCVCYDRLGEHKLAYRHNEQALAYRPTDKRMLQNKSYFETILGISGGQEQE